MNPAEDHWIADVLLQFRKYKKLAEGALAQVSDADFVRTIDPESNSIALVVKHLAGNMRSRWTDFLTSDGEKPDRNRDSEFVIEPRDTRAELERRWNEGWHLAISALEPLSAGDLTRTVQIRGEAHSVLRAINRQISHYAYHVGQLVFLAKHFAGSQWKTLSIPRARSEEVNARARNSSSGGDTKPSGH